MFKNIIKASKLTKQLMLLIYDIKDDLMEMYTLK